jgi:signal peptidase I
LAQTEEKKNLKSEITSLLLVILFALSIRTFVIELFFVPTPSMQATILANDYIFSTKYSYGFSRYSIPFSPDLFKGRIFASVPERGDIIIMRPPHDMNTRYIKRLIGLPGEKIEIKKDVTYINDIPVERTKVGEYLDETNQEYVKYKETFPNGLRFYTYKLKELEGIAETGHSDFGPYIVPKDHFFFMGDNRDQSGDSRYQLGFVSFENLIAKAQFVFLSTKEIFWDEKLGILDQLARFWTWLSSVRFDRLFKSLYDIDK